MRTTRDILNFRHMAIPGKKKMSRRHQPMADIYNLQRFLDAQEPTYDIVLAELQAGRKSSHWIWFIFPQITGLGHSDMAQQFAIGSLDEAKAYLQHSLLGSRLRTCTQLVLDVNGLALKRSSPTPTT